MTHDDRNRTKLVRWASPQDLVERRSHQVRPGRSAIGRSTIIITCPFCHADVVAYSWSLAGGGKRCPCGVLHGPRGESQGWKTTEPRQETREQ